MSVKVTIYNKQKKCDITPDIRRLIKTACTATLKAEQFGGNAEIEVTIVDDSRIKEINNDCRGINAATDVLSFPLGENGVYDKNPETGAFMLGDVVISAEHAVAQGEKFGHGVSREIAYLTVHSVLHLLGYDHVNSKKEKTVMRNHEETVMNMIGLPENKG
ncbi:MAG: rRNA maturation RNase YbeY [Clostridia bacterium]|nr:rRNA maturation RNase YbeY [Clostridia bacterium]